MENCKYDNPNFNTQDIGHISERLKSPNITERLRAAKELAGLAIIAAQTETGSIQLASILDKACAEEALRDSEGHFRSLFENAVDGIIYTSPNAEITDFNRAFANIHGYTMEEMRTIDLRVLNVDDEDLPQTAFQSLDQVAKSEDTRLCVKHLHKDGRIINLEVTQYFIELRGEPCLVAFYRDITEQKRLEQELTDYSMRDKLSGLFNRRYFDQQFDKLEKSKRNEYPLSIIYADIDRLKKVNDELGHPAGDMLIKRVSETLRETFRPEDCVARLGGDEFAILLTNVDEITTQNLVGRLKSNLTKNNQKYLNDPTISISIGAATADGDISLLEALELADNRMYEIKQAKGGTRS